MALIYTLRRLGPLQPVLLVVLGWKCACELRDPPLLLSFQD
jgi:hypothetical protein